MIYEIFFSVFGVTGGGVPMPVPGQGGIQLMRRVMDVVLPQVSNCLSRTLADIATVYIRVRGS